MTKEKKEKNNPRPKAEGCFIYKSIMFDYEAKGKIRIVGCAIFDAKKNYIVKFLEGTKAFVKKKARLGVVEYIVIKKTRRIMPANPSCYGIQPEIMYTDTFNRIWCEEELISQESAIDLAKLYWENINQEGRALFEEGGMCFSIE